jgi:hypothetical protein
MQGTSGRRRWIASTSQRQAEARTVGDVSTTNERAVRQLPPLCRVRSSQTCKTAQSPLGVEAVGTQPGWFRELDYFSRIFLRRVVVNLSHSSVAQGPNVL